MRSSEYNPTLSAFLLFPLRLSAAGDLSQVFAFPVPFKPSQGHDRITFLNLPSEATIRARFYWRSTGPPETFQSSRMQPEESVHSTG